MMTRTALHGAGTPHRRYHQVANLEILHPGANLHHFSHRFVSDHQVVGALRRVAVVEHTDFAVGAADPHIEALDENLVLGLPDRLRMIDQPDFFFETIDRYSLHKTPPSGPEHPRRSRIQISRDAGV